MLHRKRKINQHFSKGGYKQYRTPSVFSGKSKKSKKKLELPKFNIKPVIFVAVLLLALYYIFLSGKFTIREVMIEGNKEISSDKISQYVHKGKNILFFNSSNLRKQILADNPQIQDVQIIRGIPDAVKIVVLEHENKMIWQTGGIKYLVSTQGEITKQVMDGETYDFPVVSDSKNLPVNLSQDIVSPNFIAFITNVKDNFFGATNIKPTYFEVPETTFDVYLYTEAGFYVKFNSMRSSSKQLENLKKVLVEKRSDVHEYVDLRIDGWAYYK